MVTLTIALAGVVGTTAMIGFMALIHRMKWANADMVRALGSIYTQSYKSSLIPGLLIKYSFGIAFAFIYSLLLGFSPVITSGTAVIISILTGLVHGLVVGLFLVVMVAEFHPVKEFREAGVDVALAHVAGHVVYGVMVGIMFSLCWDILGEPFTSMSPGKVIGDILGFVFIWMPLFGMPLIFGGYVAYMSFTDKIRQQAHLQEMRGVRTKKVSRAKVLGGRKARPMRKTKMRLAG